MKKLLLLLFSLVISSNTMAGSAFVCKDWEQGAEKIPGTLMIGERIGENYRIKDLYKTQRFLKYLGRHNNSVNIYTSDEPNYDAVSIFSIQTAEVSTKGYDFSITQWSLIENSETFCNYQ